MIGRVDTPPPERDSGLQGFDDFDLKLGDVMRGERATLGKSLLDVQREIKIKATYIAAIENADLTVFETPGFIAGYVRSYARYLGMNPDWVYRTFCVESGFSHVAGLDAQVYTKTQGSRTKVAVKKSARPANGFSDEMLARSPIQSAPSPGFFAGIQPGAVGSLLVLAGLIGALGYGGWSVLQEIQRVTVAPIETSIAAVPGTTSGLADDGLIASNTAPRSEALERLYRPQALDRPVLVARDGPIATLDPRAQGVFATYTGSSPDLPSGLPVESSATASVASETSPEIQVVEASPPEVVLFARRPAWVRVKAADGTVLLEKILESGERYVLPDTEEPPTLRAGNSGSLYFAVNGKALGPAGPGTSVAKNVSLAPDALSEKYAQADLSVDPELARMAALVVEPEPDPLGSQTPAQ